MPLLRALPDIEVPSPETEGFLHRPLLVLERRARQVEVHPIQARLRLLVRKEPDPEPGVITRNKRGAVPVAIRGWPSEDPGPEARKTAGVVGIDAQGDEVACHGSSDPAALAAKALSGRRRANARTLEEPSTTLFGRIG